MKIPNIRIGVIQSADVISFHCNDSFNICDAHGRVLIQGKPRINYAMTGSNIQPADLVYRVRLGISLTLETAKDLQKKFAEKGLETEFWHKGLNVKIGDQTWDNREYWLVTETFEDIKSAEKFILNYEPKDEVVIVKDIQKPAQGRLDISDQRVEQPVLIIPENQETRIYLDNVPIGIQFHWQHTKTLEYANRLEVGVNNAGKLVAINELDIETYLASVNSSEMTVENPIELLKAQTIAGRSTLLATMGKHHYDENYHLCSDDHCQCFHGMEKIKKISLQASELTRGQVLCYENRVCDARYSKICGGISEDYGNVWENLDIPYLQSIVDSDKNINIRIGSEAEIKEYIDSNPDVFCNTSKNKIKSKLPYNTLDLFRWSVRYSSADLEKLIKSKIRQDFGYLIDIIPGKRGRSGRLLYIDIIGSKKSIRIGKELAIRNVLSDSHLYSACFYIERILDNAGKVVEYHFKGAGWGHGVGMCQVGATYMAQQGYTYQEILSHYYKHISLKKLY